MSEVKSHFSISWHSYSVHWQSFLSCEECFLLGQKFSLRHRIAVLPLMNVTAQISFERNMDVSAWSLALWQNQRGTTAVPRPSAPLVMLQTLPPAHLRSSPEFTGDICMFEKKLLHVERRIVQSSVFHTSSLKFCGDSLSQGLRIWVKSLFL